jgi:hypothetical protein
LIALLLAVTLPPRVAEGQILRDLEDVSLGYEIYLDEDPEPIGTFDISFVRGESSRGPHLEVRARSDYTVPLTNPFRHQEDVELYCNEEGIYRFVATRRSGDVERKVSALRKDFDYHVTSELQGKTTQTMITAGVRRSNLGLFCGGFLETPLDQDEMFVDFPLLYPVYANHEARQKYREMTIPMDVGADEPVPIIVSRVQRKDKKSDAMWNTASPHQILIRYEEPTSYGKMVYQLVTVNGEPFAESELIR